MPYPKHVKTLKKKWIDLPFPDEMKTQMDAEALVLAEKLLGTQDFIEMINQRLKQGNFYKYENRNVSPAVGVIIWFRVDGYKQHHRYTDWEQVHK